MIMDAGYMSKPIYNSSFVLNTIPNLILLHHNK